MEFFAIVLVSLFACGAVGFIGYLSCIILGKLLKNHESVSKELDGGATVFGIMVFSSMLLAFIIALFI